MTTPKRNRGQHAKRHPWSNAKAPKAGLSGMGPIMREADCLRWDAFTKFRKSDEGERLSNMAKPAVIYSCFMAGYRAGKGAK